MGDLGALGQLWGFGGLWEVFTCPPPRELPPLAQSLVLRLLFLELPLPQAALGLWVKKEHERWGERGLGGAGRVLGGLGVTGGVTRG